MINQGQMDCNITFRGIGQSGDPIVEITKIIILLLPNGNVNPVHSSSSSADRKYLSQINNHVFFSSSFFCR